MTETEYPVWADPMDIIGAVAGEFGLTTDELVDAQLNIRGPSVKATARALLAYLLRQLTPLSLSQIADEAGYGTGPGARAAVERVELYIKIEKSIRLGPNRVERIGRVVLRLKGQIPTRFDCA